MFSSLFGRNRKQLVEINNFDAYIYRIAKFRVLKYLRDDKTLTVDLDEVPIELLPLPKRRQKTIISPRESIDALNEAIEQLPAKSKLAFKLVREDGMKYKRCGRAFGEYRSKNAGGATNLCDEKKLRKIFNID